MIETILIESTRDRHQHGNACLITWGPRQWYAPVADIRATAEDLFTAAAYADLIGELLRVDIPGQIISGMVTSMFAGQHRSWLGTARTLYLLPGGSSARKAGAVVVSRSKSLYRGGKAEFGLSPSEARAMGRAWFQAAEASEADTLFSSVLERAGWMSPEEMNALFGLLNDIRSSYDTT